MEPQSLDPKLPCGTSRVSGVTWSSDLALSLLLSPQVSRQEDSTQQGLGLSLRPAGARPHSGLENSPLRCCCSDVGRSKVRLGLGIGTAPVMTGPCPPSCPHFCLGHWLAAALLLTLWLALTLALSITAWLRSRQRAEAWPRALLGTVADSLQLCFDVTLTPGLALPVSQPRAKVRCHRVPSWADGPLVGAQAESTWNPDSLSLSTPAPAFVLGT